MKLFHKGYYCFVSGLALLAGISPVYASSKHMIIPPPQGTLGIYFSKADTTQVVGLHDMLVPTNSSANGIEWVNDVCVTSPSQSPSYNVKVIGSPKSGGALVMSDGEHKLPYNVAWYSSSYNCDGNSGSKEARLTINISKENLQAANSGNYADSLTLVIAPN